MKLRLPQTAEGFTFEISLSVLNHLGRSLYRSFATVIGEAISNSWDADARNVHIEIGDDKKSFLITDDGRGMTAQDFQDKFLTIGYSKRKKNSSTSPKGRPFIGRKGIGKLAQLSCADRITGLSRVKGGACVGGIIDNAELDEAITDDVKAGEYPLGSLKQAARKEFTREHRQGTTIRFAGLKDGITHSLESLAATIALYFRFSLLDKNFSIYLDGEKITHEHLKPLAKKTEFLWEIGDAKDPYVSMIKRLFRKDPAAHERKALGRPHLTGFIASVKKPRDLSIVGTGERVGIDLFVNGRVRERDILKHIPTARVAESYLYGQIHFNALDDAKDRFTSSREGIVADDEKYADFLEKLRETILKVVEDWDRWRVKHREEGDPENSRLSKKERASRGLFGVVADEFELPKGSKNQEQTGEWVDELMADAVYNFESYADCFLAENLVRKLIREIKQPLSSEAKKEADRWRRIESENKAKANLSIPIRSVDEDVSYLSMGDLANMVDKKDVNKDACLPRDAQEYRPVRDAVAHTSLITDKAKKRLASVRENINARVKTLLAQRKAPVNPPDATGTAGTP